MNRHDDLYWKLVSLRPQLAATAQKIYDEWEEDDEPGGGICDEISREMARVIAGAIEDVDINEGGQDGDDHSWLVVSLADVQFGVDIPCHLYETGGGYSWRKIPGVTFGAQNICIWRL